MRKELRRPRKRMTRLSLASNSKASAQPGWDNSAVRASSRHLKARKNGKVKCPRAIPSTTPAAAGLWKKEENRVSQSYPRATGECGKMDPRSLPVSRNSSAESAAQGHWRQEKRCGSPPACPDARLSSIDARKDSPTAAPPEKKAGRKSRRLLPRQTTAGSFSR